MATGINDKTYYYEAVDVTLDGSGNGSTAIVFPVAFKTVPVVLVVPLLGGAAVVSATAITKTGFTFSVTGETGAVSQLVTYAYVAHEKL